MSRYHWREEASTSFGLIKRPVAEIHIKDKNGHWRAITMYIDSGADVSIITKSFGELFGHKIEKGRKIKLKGIGNTELVAYVHKMTLLIGKKSVHVDVAIAENDCVPNILGRREIFDLFEIQFKNLKQQTWFIKRK